ncbi:MAG: hypothetical protein CVU39_16910 [Chloroflexi bacterium HGW-Chloroflexi-10]|nr:MAG: hypothetical protein CVU39_16910 [Chloroflexi bacterium HGW-Chloroflexi-10]
MVILEFILVFGILLFVHEFGHFIFAKLFKIKVEEFGFGFPPRLVKLGQFRETEITLNWIPFGAFVRLSGENDPQVSGGFSDSSILARFMTLFGGPLFNLMLGITVLTVFFMQVGVPDTSKVSIFSVDSGSAAEAAGLQANESILQVNDTPIQDTQTLINLINANLGQEVDLLVERPDGTQYQTTAIPAENPPEGKGRLGISLGNPYRDAKVNEAIPYAFDFTGYYTIRLLSLPGELIKGSISPAEARPVGPVGIYNIYSQVRELDEENATSTEPVNRLNTLFFIASISIALGLTNLLPLPALDGGRILLLLPELILRKRVPARLENVINMVGFVALLALMVIITTLDIVNPVVLP